MSTCRCRCPSNDEYVVELFRLATVQGDQDAHASLQQCLGEVVRGWLHRHPNRETACLLDSEEHYMARAFERYWQITTHLQQTEITSLHEALRYLQASLNGVILDTLRGYSRSGEVPLPESGKPEVEDGSDRTEVWELLQRALLNVREQRLAYLLFHCGLEPITIVHSCPQEFSDVQEISLLRRNIMDQLLCDIDHPR